jgi:hypothetical protein
MFWFKEPDIWLTLSPTYKLCTNKPSNLLSSVECCYSFTNVYPLSMGKVYPIPQLIFLELMYTNEAYSQNIYIWQNYILLLPLGICKIMGM